MCWQREDFDHGSGWQPRFQTGAASFSGAPTNCASWFTSLRYPSTFLVTRTSRYTGLISRYPTTCLRRARESTVSVHFAGILFAPLPERFLPLTNVGYVKNLLEAAKTAGVRKFILLSFPHVEGETTPEHPALGRLDASPSPVHFRTRLEAERYLFEACRGGPMIPLVCRSGMVYGSGVKMIEGARWMLRHRLMAIWKSRLGLT